MLSFLNFSLLHYIFFCLFFLCLSDMNPHFTNMNVMFAGAPDLPSTRHALDHEPAGSWHAAVDRPLIYQAWTHAVTLSCMIPTTHAHPVSIVLFFVTFRIRISRDAGVAFQ
jgi:hypothetical protein